MKINPIEMIERRFDIRHNRRLLNEGKTHARLDALETKADEMVGTLVREGRVINYIFPVGGRYMEGTRIALVAFLIRNHYV
jgi:hypothetical protein